MVERAVIVGAGIGGLGAALALGRAGHEVTLIERDELPTSPDVAEAFAADRRGVPQAHQTHGFLARALVELREHFPDVLADLLAAGGSTMPMTANLGEPEPGDEDLRVLIIRRTTFELVLRRAVYAQSGVTVRTGVAASGLLHAAGDPPTVTGVRLEDGSNVTGDVVVVSTGRRSMVPDWLGEIGVSVPETVRESGLMYLTRWYHLPADFGPVDPKLGGDLNFVKYLAVPGDGDTLSITLAIRPDDAELRRALSDPIQFEAACRVLPGPDQFFARTALEPIGPVRPMGGLLNRLRRFVDESGAPTVLGFHAIGDAHTCTNPLYGRGCSLALVQGLLLAHAIAAHPGDAVARAIAYEDACKHEVEPWFDISVTMDEAGADPAGFALDGPPSRALAPIFVAAERDPIIGRGFARFWNLLATPADMMQDAVLMARMADVMAHPEAYQPPPVVGPTRAELLEKLAA
jgi:2-polyprenyl-6-methoxyphenol hydroxylase-like FAD-dependent oxidoreductase